jgi:transcriptional regulator with XRE-family HTH domain
MSPPTAPVLRTGPNRFVERLEQLIAASGKTQRQIAGELGYDRPNLITMFKQGITRVPGEKVAALAHSLGADEADLLRLWLETYAPELKQTIEGALGLALSENEKAWITGLRSLFGDGVPPFEGDAVILTRLLAEAWLARQGRSRLLQRRSI